MKTMTKHPLRITADQLRNSFARCGFALCDNGTYPELERSDLNVKIFENPAALSKAVLLADGSIALRRQLLPYALPYMKNTGKAAAFGKVFNGGDEQYPARHRIEGIIKDGTDLYDAGVLWKKIVRTAFGAGYDAKLVRLNADRKLSDLSSWGASAMKDTSLAPVLTWEIKAVRPDHTEFTLGCMGTLTWMGKALLNIPSDTNECFAFCIDVDEITMEQYGLSQRKDLYDNREEYLCRYTDDTVSASDAFEDKCRDTLRTMGYSEGFGMKIYPDGIYKKMNMIQDSWDLNNQGVRLTSPLGEGTGLPTVLTPAIEQIISEKWQNHEAEAHAFEISHIFIPQKNGDPIEKLAVSFASYGPEVTLASFTKEVSHFLDEIGNKNHFFIPNDMAIAYKTGECRLILDERMSYLGGNFGGISEKAEENFSLGIHAYMANLEMMPLENKAAEEYGYIAPELR